MHPVDELVTHTEASVNGVRLHWVEAGEGPLVILLHGFPEFWYSWRNQIPTLVEAGYRVIAPDMRGFARSGKPEGYDAYRAEAVAGDVAGLIAAAGETRATIVGHDWGGTVAWLTALARPQVVDRLVIANSPHPGVFLRAVRKPLQLVRSSYMAFFQLPVLPELTLRAANFTVLRAVLRAAGRPGAFTEADLDRYAEAYANQGALTGSLAYYRAMGRAMARSGRRAARQRVVTSPTLMIWGRNDPVLSLELADPGRKRVPTFQLEVVDDAGHFVQSDAPEQFNALLLEFLREARPVSSPT